MKKNIILQLLDFCYPLVKGILKYEVYVYLAAGSINTLLNIGLFTGLYLLFSKNYFAIEVATGLSFLITVVTGFYLNKYVAFTNAVNEKMENRKQFAKYSLVAIQGQFSGYLLTKLMVFFLHVPGIYAYVLTTVIMLTINYFLQKHFTFTNKHVLAYKDQTGEGLTGTIQ